jgi:signal peptidase I
MEPGHPLQTEGTKSSDKTNNGRRGGVLGVVVEVVVIVVAAYLIAMLFQAFIVKPFAVDQTSMLPTLEGSDRILVSRLTYHFRDPKPGDVIVFRSPMVKDKDWVKRVIAVEGQKISIQNGYTYIDGVRKEEPYLHKQGIMADYAEAVVPKGCVFVMGDNRGVSEDSRMFGFLDKEAIIGKAFVVMWPINRWKGL